jgi:hypothetical protein
VAKEPVDQKHTRENRCKIEIGLHMRPEPLRRDTYKVPVLKTEIPEFKKEPKNGRPKKQDGKFSRPPQNKTVVPPPPQEAIQKNNKPIPGKGIGVCIERRDVMKSSPKGENDRTEAEKDHQFADEAGCHKTKKLPALRTEKLAAGHALSLRAVLRNRIAV